MQVMTAFLIILAALYVLGFALILWMHTQMPCTFGLALLRSFLWPLWVTTGIPRGELLPMD